jgi:hypothetical protein
MATGKEEASYGITNWVQFEWPVEHKNQTA